MKSMRRMSIRKTWTSTTAGLSIGVQRRKTQEFAEIIQECEH
jgi:hypothetical protein